MKFNERCIEVWGSLAMFTDPQTKVCPTSYRAPTPSAMRGLLNCIYNKPIEFYYQINKIEVLKPIKYQNVMTNGLMAETPLKQTDVRDLRTQFNASYLKDVRYRVWFEIIMRKDTNLDSHVSLQGILNQFDERIERGAFFRAPSLGRKECVCFFDKPNFDHKPIEATETLGMMLYDVFDFTKYTPENKTKIRRSWFNAIMNNGVINVPPIESDLVIKEMG